MNLNKKEKETEFLNSNKNLNSNKKETEFYVGIIVVIEFKEELEDSYLEYTIFVMISRAIPRASDGFKTSQIRILYCMYKYHHRHTDKFVKCSQIVGEVMGHFHPHGDAAIYDALARMAQDTAMSIPLIQGHGNLGDTDHEPAAHRYTEARLAPISEYILGDLKYDVVEMQPTYDGSGMEPTVLPVQFPQLLVNGASGIAVGIATNIPPHNLKEVIEATKYFINNPQCSVDELMHYLPAPDFPTKGELLYSQGIKQLYEEGKGSFSLRARAEIKDKCIIFTELPYQVSKSIIVVQIASLIEKNELPGVSDVADESDKHGIKVVVYLKKDAYKDMLLKKLYSSTSLEVQVNSSMVVLLNSVPQTVGLKDLLGEFVKFRNITLISKFSYKLKEAREKMHSLIGLVVAKDNLEEMLEMIKKSNFRSDAMDKLMKNTWKTPSVEQFLQKEFDTNVDSSFYQLSEQQCDVILEMRVHQLTKLENTELLRRIHNLKDQIIQYGEIISSDTMRKEIILQELTEIGNLSSPRRTNIIRDFTTTSPQDLIPNESFIIFVDHNNCVKKMNVSEYKTQHRGGMGKSSVHTSCTIISKALDTILMFSNKGRVYSIQSYHLPTMSAQAKGRSLVNFFPIQSDEVVVELVNLDAATNEYVVFVTAHGMVKKNSIHSFSRIRSGGKTAMLLNGEDYIIKALCVSGESSVVIVTEKGRTVRFNVRDLREIQSCNTYGVIGIRLAKDDLVTDACTTLPGYYLVSVSKNGMAKITTIDEYRTTKKGAKGINCMRLSDNDRIATIFSVSDLDREIFTITNKGQISRTLLNEIRETGRNTKGVRLVKLKDDFITKSMEFHGEVLIE